MKKAIIAYVPVLHDGYRKFFEKHQEDADLYILGSELITEFTHLAKEIRALDPILIKKAIEGWNIINKVSILDKKTLNEVIGSAEIIILPDEDIMHELQQKYFPKKESIFDSIFLRWDKHNTVKKKPIVADNKISSEDFDKKMMLTAEKESEKSSDWWRRVGAVIIKNGKVIISAHNRHVPSEHLPYANGDPRNNFHKGVHLELSTALHGEAGAIAEAARQGVSLEGADIYVSTFPCPPCAKLIAYSGIKRIYYSAGYGVLDGESILRDRGVEIIFVEK